MPSLLGKESRGGVGKTVALLAAQIPNELARNKTPFKPQPAQP